MASDMPHSQYVASRATLLGILRAAIIDWKRAYGDSDDADVIARPIERVLESLEDIVESK